jgi:hypothetical protein
MKVTVDDKGTVRPARGARRLFASGKLASPEDKVRTFIYICRFCGGHFYAREGETTVHECPKSG